MWLAVAKQIHKITIGVLPTVSSKHIHISLGWSSLDCTPGMTYGGSHSQPGPLVYFTCSIVLVLDCDSHMGLSGSQPMWEWHVAIFGTSLDIPWHCRMARKACNVLALRSMQFLVHLMPTTFGQFPELFSRTSRVLAGHCIASSALFTFVLLGRGSKCLCIPILAS